MPDWIGSLTSLEQLKINFNSKADHNKIRVLIKELGSLRELKVLEFSFWSSSPVVTDKSAQRDLVESLRKLHKIQHLEIQQKPWTQLTLRSRGISATYLCPVSGSLGCRHALIYHVFTTSPTWNCLGLVSRF